MSTKQQYLEVEDKQVATQPNEDNKVSDAHKGSPSSTPLWVWITIFVLTTIAIAFIIVSAVYIKKYNDVSKFGSSPAICVLQSDNGSSVAGTLTLTQAKSSDALAITGTITGLNASQTHGFHIHQYGVGVGCASAGGHYNPNNTNHGDQSNKIDLRHVGDFGNITSNASGSATVAVSDVHASLYGVDSVIGRSLMVHAGTDDLGLGGDKGSVASGNAGARWGCCTIGYQKVG